MLGAKFGDDLLDVCRVHLYLLLINANIGSLSNSHFCSRELICFDKPFNDTNFIPCEAKNLFLHSPHFFKKGLNPIPLKKDFHDGN